MVNESANVVGLSLNTGQVLVQTLSWGDPSAIQLGTIGSAGAIGWNNLTAGNGDNATFLRGVVATGLTDDGRVLFKSRPGDTFISVNNVASSAGMYDPASGQRTIFSIYNNPSQPVLVNGAYAVITRSNGSAVSTSIHRSVDLATVGVRRRRRSPSPWAPLSCRPARRCPSHRRWHC